MRWLALVCSLGFALAELALPGAVRAEAACTPWPGEPDPLPDVHHPDPFSARWARLRSQELVQAARELETQSQADVRWVWEHVGCLDPESDAARDALARLEAEAAAAAAPPPETAAASDAAPEPPPPQPEPEPVAPRRAAPRSTHTSAREPVAVVPPPGPTAEASAPDARITQLEELLFEARFRAALALAAQLRGELTTGPERRRAGARRARIELLTGTAQLALRHARAARESFARALRAEPGLRLAPAATSPRVRRAFEAVRAGGAGAGE